MELTKEAYLRTVAFQMAWANSADVMFPTEQDTKAFLANEADKFLGRLQAYVDAPLSKAADPFS